MTKKELIEALSPYPDHIDVVIHNWKQSLYNDMGDGSEVGTHSDFNVDGTVLYKNCNDYEDQELNELSSGDCNVVLLTFNDEERDEDGRLYEVLELKEEISKLQKKQ